MEEWRALKKDLQWYLSSVPSSRREPTEAVIKATEDRISAMVNAYLNEKYRPTEEAAMPDGGDPCRAFTERFGENARPPAEPEEVHAWERNACEMAETCRAERDAALKERDALREALEIVMDKAGTHTVWRSAVGDPNDPGFAGIYEVARAALARTGEGKP